MPEPQTILVASGQEAAIAIALERAGWATTAARDALMVHNATRRAKLAAALIDANLPRGGAQLAIKYLRSSVDCAAIPIIVMGTDPGQAHVFIDCGAQAFLKSPASPEDVVVALKQHLKAPAPVVNGVPAEIIEDPARLAALRASGLLDSQPDHAFDDVARLIMQLLQAPTALLSVVDRDRQFFKSRVGLREPYQATGQTPLSHSFCQWVVSGREQITIKDARAHPVLKSNPAVRDLGVVAYTGVPVCSADGQALGSLCAIDEKPRDWTADQIGILQDLAKLVEAGAAHGMVVKQPPKTAAEFDRYVGAAGDAVTAATRLLRRDALNRDQRAVLLAGIERHSGHLVQLNRLIQVSQALQ